MKFSELGLSQDILRAANGQGYKETTPIQTKAVPHVLKGRDLIACAQTGTGKTAAFAMPLLERLHASDPYRSSSQGGRPGSSRPAPSRREYRNVRALILSPTRELTSQIAESISVYGHFTGLQHVVVYGGVSQVPQVKKLRRGVDILVATPGRLLDLINQGHVNLTHVETLIFDEADQMLDMGFIHDLRKIVQHVPKKRQTLMFSATMPPEIRKAAGEWLTDPIHIETAPAATPAERVEQSVFFVEKRHKQGLLNNFLHEKRGRRTLVFSRTKHGADNIVRKLLKDGIQAAAIHGNKSQSNRQRVLAQFKSNSLPVLVATDVAARGLDINDVSYVINYDLPDVPEAYVHRIGRTGRAGASGIAISFCGSDERRQLRMIERLIRRKIAVEDRMPEKAASLPPIQGESSEQQSRSSDGPKKSRPGGYGRGKSQNRGKTQNRRKPREGASADRNGRNEGAERSGAKKNGASRSSSGSNGSNGSSSSSGLKQGNGSNRKRYRTAL